MSSPFYTPPDVLDEQALGLEQLAHACRMHQDWVIERVTTGILQQDTAEHDAPPAWRFSAHTVIRARRIADLERTFDADPQLAALTADLIEEVQQLRRKLKA